MKYSIAWVKALFDADQKLKYIFFWSHQVRKDGQVSKSCFSQWYPSIFEVDNIQYSSAEQWMMAEKARLFNDLEVLNQILTSASPAEAKKLGRAVRGFDQSVWNSHKYEIVKIGNYHKFSQDESLKEFLLQTQQRILVEASPYDKIWGVGMKAGDAGIENPNNWKGINLLGFALMEVRDQLSAG